MEMLASIFMCAIVAAAGHGLMVSPNPRTGTSDAGQNKGRGAGPCGRSNQLQTQGSPSAVFTVGDTVQISWQTTIPHGGTCRISFTTRNDAVPTSVDDQGRLDSSQPDVHVLTPDFPCCQQRGIESRNVTIPAEAQCEACVLQWFWTGDGPYYNCADVQVKPRVILSEPPVGLIPSSSQGGGALVGAVVAGITLMALAALAYLRWRHGETSMCSCIKRITQSQDHIQHSTANSQTALPDPKHSYGQMSFNRPTWCQQCQKFIWGFANQGYECSQCHLVVCKACAAKPNASKCKCPVIGSV